MPCGYTILCITLIKTRITHNDVDFFGKRINKVACLQVSCIIITWYKRLNLKYFEKLRDLFIKIFFSILALSYVESWQATSSRPFVTTTAGYLVYRRLQMVEACAKKSKLGTAISVSRSQQVYEHKTIRIVCYL